MVVCWYILNNAENLLREGLAFSELFSNIASFIGLGFVFGHCWKYLLKLLGKSKFLCRSLFVDIDSSLGSYNLP